MSESFKPLDPLTELDRLAVDLDFDLDLDASEAPSRSARKVRILPVGIRSLSNSPGAAPHTSLARESSRKARPASQTRPDGLPEREAEATAEDSGEARQLQPIRRARPVRVDAWAVPASANWTRTHKTTRKIRRVSRSTDWALPF